VLERDGVLDEGDELEGLFATLGGIAGTAVAPGIGTTIGSLLGGLLDPSEDDSGGGAPAPAALPGGALELPAPPRMLSAADLRAAAAAPVSLEAVRSVVRDALADDQATHGHAALDEAGRERVTRLAASRIVQTLDPTARRVRGALYVQRLQKQASDEHARAKARADSERRSSSRHGELVTALARAERSFRR
jgi:hypothetical protein